MTTKIEEIELIETNYKTKRKFEKRGTYRLKHIIMNLENKSAMDVLINICESVDCNFHEVLDAINRTTR